MSEARQCDRCNKFYSINDKNEKRGEYPITEDYKKAYKKPVGSMSLYDNNVNRIKHLDLCPTCSRSLMDWLYVHNNTLETDAEVPMAKDEEDEINHYNCPYRKDVVCAKRGGEECNDACKICDIYQWIFGKGDSE